MLEKGDVIKVENGMKVNTLVPEKFIYGNRVLSDEISKTVIVVGKTLTQSVDAQKKAVNSLVKRVITAFDYEGVKITEKEALVFVNETLSTIGSKPLESFTFNEGEFLVIETKSDGGGTGHGMHDVYPNGHHVFAKRLADDGSYDPEGDEVDFYQSGSFTHTNEQDIPVIRKMTITTTYA